MGTARVSIEEAELSELSLSERAAAAVPYLQPLLDDRDVQASVRRLAGAGRKTYERARGKPPGKALKDKRVRQRVREAAIAAWQVLAAIDDAQTRHRRPRWRRRVLLVLTVSAGAYGVYLVSNGEGRPALRNVIGDHDASSRSSS